MKFVFLFAFLLLAGLEVQAQDFLTGKLTEAGGTPQEVLYDRTQMAINANVFKSVYKVMDKSKNVLYTISLTEDQTKSAFVIYIRPENGASKIMTVEYDAAKSGLIFSDLGNQDTAYNTSKSYAYLISFSDATRDYPILHKIKTDDSKEIELDPLSKLRLRKHVELIRNGGVPVVKTTAPSSNGSAETATTKTKEQAPAAKNNSTTNSKDKDNDITKVAEQRRNIEQMVKDEFSLQLLRLRDSLYTRSYSLTRTVTKNMKALQTDSAVYFKSKKPTTETRRYKGKKKNGKYDGKGILAVYNNVYQGTFAKGNFSSGKVAIRADVYEYYGDYAKDTFNGLGWLKYKDGSFYLGIFRSGNLYSGVLSTNEPNGDIYFGLMKDGQRTGYGELHDPKGHVYYGEFLNARLIKGFAKEVDRFGYSTYSKIEKGSKKSIEPEIGEDFFKAATPKK